MTQNQDIDEVAPGLCIWSAYDPSVKVDLFSTALATPSGTFLVDPIHLAPASLLRLRTNRILAGIVATNVNHARAAIEFAESFSVPLYVHDQLCGAPDFPGATQASEGTRIDNELAVIMIDGGPLGELALHHDRNRGTLIIGDALTNLTPNGLEFLPAKYCRDSKLMRLSLKKLLNYPFERMFFAHGTPILSSAKRRLEQLLAAV